jgi:hypothetical protein
VSRLPAPQGIAVERDDDGKVFVPWDEIDFKLPLTREAA